MTDIDITSRDSEAIHVRYDPARTLASTAIVEGIAALEGLDPTEIRPLHDSIPPDALNDLLETRRRRNGDVSVSFRTDHHEIEVRSDGKAIVTRRGS